MCTATSVGPSRWASRCDPSRRAGQGHAACADPPVLVRMLRERIEHFGEASDGRVFLNAAGNYLDAAAYSISWHPAPEAALTGGVRRRSGRACAELGPDMPRNSCSEVGDGREEQVVVPHFAQRPRASAGGAPAGQLLRSGAPFLVSRV
ncbi:protein of unknown function [Streptomyces murinus]